jgi:hypothetical protein
VRASFCWGFKSCIGISFDLFMITDSCHLNPQFMRLAELKGRSFPPQEN